jgi:hypothetical protein
MTIRPTDAYLLRRLLVGHFLNGELETVSRPFRGVADHLAALSVEARQIAWEGFLSGRDDRDRIIMTLADVDPEGPAPTPEAERLTAHLGDLDNPQNSSRFLWPHWIVRGHFNLLSSDPKIGKTHLALDWARRIYFALTWPDGQAATFPEGTRTLWVCGDRHQDELRERAAAFGLPPEAILLNASPDDPYGGWDLDNPENVEALRHRAETEAPGLIFIDTVWRATRRKLSREDEVNLLMDPLISMAQECEVAIVGLMHLSKDAETLGRRLEGLARAILKMFKPDPDQPARRKLEVIGNFKEPPPLGVMLRNGGCDFDSEPPSEPAKHPGGRPRVEREKARQFIIDALTRENNRKAAALCAEYVQSGGAESTFWNARDDMVEAGELVCDGKPKIMHLIRLPPDEDQPH